MPARLELNSTSEDRFYKVGFILLVRLFCFTAITVLGDGKKNMKDGLLILMVYFPYEIVSYPTFPSLLSKRICALTWKV